MKFAAILLAAAALAAPVSVLAAPQSAILKATERRDGLLPVHIDNRGGRILLALPEAGRDGVIGRYLYVTALRTGLGSAPIGLDRSLSGGSKLLVVRRIGKKIALEVENPKFRASDAAAAEQDAVRESFAYSTLWMGDAIDADGGGSFVDIAPFLAADTMGIGRALQGGGEKGYALSKELSVADPASVRAFPDNIEMEARQTFVSSEPGAETRNIAPQSGNVSFIVRHSLIRLPAAGFTPQRFDPRTGSFATQVVDFAAPLGQSVVYELANRFRLEKIDPAAPRSRVRKPITFYIDHGAPEPIRTALYEGTLWWKQAFDEAGFIDAFQVEILPADIDPLDIRYNVVNWVNRATRGWSYGQVIEDPRTGEIVKGQVLLGSLRVRQDMLIFEGLVGADKVGTGGPNDPVQAALARLRQLAAHEVGHALGIAHNFAGSIQGRYSVMDYPAPRVGLGADGAPDLGDAYGVGLGRWDIHAVNWLYGSDSEAEAQATAAAGVAEGLRYVGDGDARSADAAHPVGSLWDDGADPVAELERMMGVRRAAVDRFGLAALAGGEPVANLRRKFVPIWLLHRYQVEAATKLVGGIDYHYAVRGDGTEAARPVADADQRRALAALLATLSADALTVPPALVPYLSAGWSGSSDRQFDIEVMPTADGPVFDASVAAEVAARQTLDALLAADRLNRLAEQNRRDPALPGAADTIDRVIDAGFGFDGAPHLRRRVATATLFALVRAARDADLSPALAVALDGRIARLGEGLAKRGGDEGERDWSGGLAALIADRERLDAAAADPRRNAPVPPGMPIGSGGDAW